MSVEMEIIKLIKDGIENIGPVDVVQSNSVVVESFTVHCPSGLVRVAICEDEIEVFMHRHSQTTNSAMQSIEFFILSDPNCIEKAISYTRFLISKCD